MRVRSFLLVVMALSASLGTSQAAPELPCVEVPVLDSRCESWVAHGSHEALETGGPIATSADSVFTASIRYGADGFGDWSVQAYSKQGALRWTRPFAGAKNLHDFPYSIAVAPSGDRIYVAGLADSDYHDGSLAVVAFDAASGGILWTRLHVGVLGGMTYARSIAVTGDGQTLVVTGSVHDGEFTDAAYETLALRAADGGVRWNRSYHPGPASPYAVALSPEGATAYVTGIAGTGFGGNYVIGTIAYAVATGDERWVSSFEGGFPIDGGQSVAVSPDGARVVVAGWSQVGAPTTLRVRSAFTVVALDATSGATQWSSRTEGARAGLAVVQSVLISADGKTVVAAGYVQGDVPELDFDLRVMAFEAATGTVRWESRQAIPGMLAETVGLGRIAALSPDGTRAYVAGQVRPVGPTSLGQDPSDAVTFAFDVATGAVSWTARYRTGPADSTVGAAVAVDDAVYLSGGTSSPVDMHALVMRYEL